MSNKPRFGERAAAFAACVQGAEPVIHNAPFDAGFFDRELRLAGLGSLSSHVAGITGSLMLARQAFPGKRNSLNALCERFGIDRSSRTRYGALQDCMLLARIYLCLTGDRDAWPDSECQIRAEMDQGRQAPDRGRFREELPADAAGQTVHRQADKSIGKSGAGILLRRAIQAFWRGMQKLMQSRAGRESPPARQDGGRTIEVARLRVISLPALASGRKAEEWAV